DRGPNVDREGDVRRRADVDAAEHVHHLVMSVAVVVVLVVPHLHVVIVVARGLVLLAVVIVVVVMVVVIARGLIAALLELFLRLHAVPMHLGVGLRIRLGVGLRAGIRVVRALRVLMVMARGRTGLPGRAALAALPRGVLRSDRDRAGHQRRRGYRA